MLEQFDTDRWLSKLELEEFPGPKPVRLKYPVLLCHGYGAIASLVKPSPLYDVAMLLRSHNVAAFSPNIVPYAKIETRARGWMHSIHEVTGKRQYEKVNIIAHSVGGLDIRYALSELDIAGKVESFTTVSTPHHGTSIAELTLNTPDPIRDKLAEFLNWMGDRVYPQTKSDTVGSAVQLTRRYITEEFNPRITDVTDITYSSYRSAVGQETSYSIRVLSRYQNNRIHERDGINDG